MCTYLRRAKYSSFKIQHEEPGSGRARVKLTVLDKMRSKKPDDVMTNPSLAQKIKDYPKSPLHCSLDFGTPSLVPQYEQRRDRQKPTFAFGGLFIMTPALAGKASRRSAVKSRTGCQNCKRRKIKVRDHCLTRSFYTADTHTIVW